MYFHIFTESISSVRLDIAPKMTLPWPGIHHELCKSILADYFYINCLMLVFFTKPRCINKHRNKHINTRCICASLWLTLSYIYSQNQYMRYLSFAVRYIVCISWKPFRQHPPDKPDNQAHVASMGPTWILSAPEGPHVGPMTLADRKGKKKKHWEWEICFDGKETIEYIGERKGLLYHFT